MLQYFAPFINSQYGGVLPCNLIEFAIAIGHISLFCHHPWMAAVAAAMALGVLSLTENAMGVVTDLPPTAVQLWG